MAARGEKPMAIDSAAVARLDKPKIDDVGGRLELLRGELTEHLDGLRNDLSGLPFVSKTSRPSGVRRAA